MPTAPGFADISVQIRLTGMSRPAYVTFGVDPTATDPVAINASVILALNAGGSFTSILDGNCTISQVRCSLGTDGAEDIVGITNTSVIGIAGLTSLPPNCALLVHKRTARGGRRGRGRMFLPWVVAETTVDEAGTISAGNMPILQTAMDTFLAQLATNGVPMYVLHGPGQTAPGAPNIVTTLGVDSLISTQRRRLGR